MSVKLPKELIQQLDRLMTQLEKGNADVRSMAMSRLTSYEQSGLIPLSLLIEMADEENPAIAMYAVSALGRSAHPDAVQKLISMASNYTTRNALFVESLIDALGETSSREATPVLLEIIGRHKSRSRGLLSKLTRRKGENAQTVQNRQDYYLGSVMRALEKIGDPKSTAPIADLLDHPDALIRCRTIRTFINADSPAQITKFRDLATADPDELVREVAQIGIDRLALAAKQLSN